MPRRRQGGFTLMEVLVALAVFAVIGVLATQILRQMTDFGGHAVERGGLLTDAQRALEIMRRDIEQLAHRPVRDVFGDAGSPVVIGGERLLEFTRLGWRNPLGEQRSDLQRVAYAWDGTELHRLFWRVLDRAPGSEASRQLLLAGVSDVVFTAVDSAGEEHDVWPPAETSDPDDQDAEELRLAGVRLRMTTDELDLMRLWTTPQGMDFVEDQSRDPLDDAELDDLPPPDDPDADPDDDDF
ncbi:MAG: type II secretion system protein GspJ [Gammaproteobacteria bacterium]|nr:type II secretion system protein GspJ [Gammaproteobacteria bacterium]